MSLKTILFLANGVALLALLSLALASARGRRATPPANKTEFYNDAVLEGPRLERVLGAAVLFSAVLAASLPVYWLIEPNRQDKMSNDFLADSIDRGHHRFARTGAIPGHSEVLPLECARCHGDEAQGGSASFLLLPDEPGELPQTVNWKAPSLDDVLLRFDEETGREQVISIITYGRPGTPMPAWGLAGGGPLNEQAITDIVNYLTSIQVKPEEAKKRNTEQIDTVLAANPGMSIGQAGFMAMCARCHTKGASYDQPEGQGAGGAFGPNLSGGVVLRQFPALSGGVQKHIEYVTDGSEFQKSYGSQGIGSGRMPGFGKVLTEEQIDQIVLYERGL